MPKPENRSKAVRIWALETKHCTGAVQYYEGPIHTSLETNDLEAHHRTHARHEQCRSSRRRACPLAQWIFSRRWVVHLLVFFLWWGQPAPESPFAAAGPRERDNRAASGGLAGDEHQDSSVTAPHSAPGAAVDARTRHSDRIAARPAATGRDGLHSGRPPGGGRPRAAYGDGRGDGGTAESGRFGKVPPSPRGIIMPPSNRNVRGQRIEVWVFVNERGRVVADSTQLRPPTSDGDFNARILREATEWVFEPAKEGGRAVSSWFPYTISM